MRRPLKRDELMAYKLGLQKNLCFFCGVPIDMAAHLDHLIPVFRGGSNNLCNLAAACRSCNLTKRTGQIESTNESTIKDYLRLIDAKESRRKGSCCGAQRVLVLSRHRRGLTCIMSSVRPVSGTSAWMISSILLI